jgi:hypothetical protein
MAQGFLKVFEFTKETRYLEIAEQWIARLGNLRVSDRGDSLWGFPFDWQSVVLIPANTPLCYTSWQAAQTYFEHHRLTGSSDALSTTSDICRSMLKTFNRPIDTSEELCLSYSPYDHMQVYNVNALMGGLFTQVGEKTGSSDLVGYGARLLNWVARGQQEDGRWVYFSQSFRTESNSADHFHTAMALQGLLSGYLAVPKYREWENALRRGTQFYLNRLFDSHFRPRFTDSRSYPTDIMSCAEGILLLDQLRKTIPKVASWAVLSLSENDVEYVLRGLVNWTTGNFQEKCGSFYFQGYPGFKIQLRSHRWGQGAMLKALGAFLDH